MVDAMTDEKPSDPRPGHDPLDPGYRFCPKCGRGLNLESLKAEEPKRLVCAGCRFVFYLDSKVATGAICTVDGAVVLLKRAIDPGYGKWVFPGGYVDRGETVEEACIRETREEVNLHVRIERLLNVYSYAGRPIIVIVYVASVVGGELQAGDETLEVRTFAPEEIPWEELAFPSTRDALRDYAKALGVAPGCPG
jgi:mutator protein MutT